MHIAKDSGRVMRKFGRYTLKILLWISCFIYSLVSWFHFLVLISGREVLFSHTPLELVFCLIRCFIPAALLGVITALYVAVTD